MPRTTTANYLAAVLAQSSGELLVAMVTLNHALLASPIRANSSGVDLTSRGNSFPYCPFGVERPNDERGQASKARLWLDNLHPDIMAALRSIDSPASGTLEFALYDTPDDLEAGPFKFFLRECEADEYRVSGKMTFWDWMAEAYPKDVINPATVPGSF